MPQLKWPLSPANEITSVPLLNPSLAHDIKFKLLCGTRVRIQPIFSSKVLYSLNPGIRASLNSQKVCKKTILFHLKEECKNIINDLSCLTHFAQYNLHIHAI